MNSNFVARFLTSYSRPRKSYPTHQTQTEPTPQKTNRKKTNWLQLWIFISAPGTNLLRFTIRKIVGTSQLLLRLFIFWLNFCFYFLLFSLLFPSFPLLFEISSHGELRWMRCKNFGGRDMCACMVRVQMRHAVNIEKTVRKKGGFVMLLL
jgi:hypothetical protein